MAQRQLFTRVRIKPEGGMKEFHGKTGTIVGTEDYGGSGGCYYRVKLDEPVQIEGVGLVTDDLWQGSLLSAIRERR